LERTEGQAGVIAGSPGGPSTDRLLEALRAATVGDFEVYEELGRGGMARVYLCYDVALDRHVAIKVMSPLLLLEEGMAERFRREAKIAASLSHPNIIPVYSVRQVGDLAFFVMKYVDGCTLEFLIAEHAPLPRDMVRQILRHVGEALVYAHDRGVIHRDIKPGNVLIDSDGRAILSDFGIARASGLTGLTATGASVGTPFYMSPEQCSRGEITGQSDQYALGILGYQMLCGKVPFTGADAAEVMQAHLLDTPEPITSLRPDCPPDLVGVVTRMLSKRPVDRWPTLEAGLEGLRWNQPTQEDQTRIELKALALTSPPRPKLPKPPTSPAPSSRGRLPVGPGGESPRSTRSPKRKLLLACGGFVFLAGAVAISMLNREDSPSPPLVADSQSARNSLGHLPLDSTAGRTSGDTAAGVAPRPVGTPVRRVRDTASQRSTKPAGREESGGKVTGPVTPAEVVPDTQQAAPLPNWADVIVGSTIDTAVLYVDGTPRYRSPKVQAWRVPAGTVKLAIHAGLNCKSWDTTVTLPAGRTTTIGLRNPVCPE